MRSRTLTPGRSGQTILKWSVASGVVVAAAYLGQRASVTWLRLLVVGMAGVVLLERPVLGLLAMIPAALVVPLEFGTGSAVRLNPATLLVPTLLALWLLDMLRRRQVEVVPSRANRPLFLFLLAGLFSSMIGTALWDPAVPRPDNFTTVQLGQWGIFAFSAGAFWLTANLVKDQVWLRHLTLVFLAFAGCIAILTVLTYGSNVLSGVTTIARARAPFWMLLAAVAGGQLIFNEGLAGGWRWFLLAILGAVAYFAFFLERVSASTWVGVAAVAGVLAWLRWPRIRWAAVLLLVALASTGLLSSAVYDFAGGDREWAESGGSRLTLIERVVEVTLRNPVTGLGPAAYRHYARMEPLPYGRAFWVEPNVSSHNNYVDLFSHAGLLGLGLFLWFAVELTRLGFRLRPHFTSGFSAGYANSMIAAWAGALVLMLLADWMLPFVYNIGFPGFQASVLVWLFLGGLVTLERIAGQPEA